MFINLIFCLSQQKIRTNPKKYQLQVAGFMLLRFAKINSSNLISSKNKSFILH